MANDFEKLISTNSIPNFVILFGEEDFLVFEAYKNLVNALNKKGDSSVEILDADEQKGKEKLFETVNSCLNSGFFQLQRIVVIKHIEKYYSGRTKKNKNDSIDNAFERFINSKLNDIFVVFITFEDSLNGLSKKIASTKDTNSKNKIYESLKYPFNILLSKHKWFEFPKVYESQIKTWITNRFKQKGVAINEQIVDFILANCNLNLWEIDHEIEKIILYFGHKTILEIGEVAQIISGTKEHSVFQIISEIARRNASNAIELVQKILNTAKQEILVVNLIFKYFRNLLILLEESQKTRDKFQLAKAIGATPYFFDDYQEGLKNYSKIEIINAINLITDTDYLLKSSSNEPIFLLELLITNLTSRKTKEVEIIR